MQRRKSTLKMTQHFQSKDPLQFELLFRNNVESDIEKHLAEELQKFKDIIEYDFNPQYKKKQLLKSYEKAQKLDNIKFQNFDDFNLKNEDRELLKDVKFVKVVNHLRLIFISCEGGVIVFNRDTLETSVLRLYKDSITAMDYDHASGAVLFGHKFGKFTFYKWTKNSLKKLDHIKLEGYSNEGIKDVKFVSGVDVIAFLDFGNNSQLLVRIPGKKIKYKSKFILNSKTEHYSLSSIRLGNGADDESNLQNTVIVAYTSAKDVKFIFFETIYEKNEFRDVDISKEIHKLEKPVNKNQDITINGLFEQKSENNTSNDQNITNNSDSMNPKEMSFIAKKTKTIVLFDNKQYLLENQPYVLVIWDNIIEQYFITPDLCFIKSFTFELKNDIVSAYICSTELLTIIFDNFQISFVYLEKLRYTLDNNKEIDDFIEHKESFTNRSENDLIGLDTLNKAACLYSNNSIQYFQIFSWENYIENLKAQSFYIEALFLLSKLVKGIPTHLSGSLFPNARGATFNLNDIQKMRMFTEDLKEIVRSIMLDMIEWLRNKKHAINLLELCIELLVKTRNFDLLYSDFLDVILTSKNNNEKLAEVFIKQLASYMNDKILNDYFSIDFFVKIFMLIENDGNITILDRFLFFIVQNFSLKNEIFEVLKIMAFNKQMPIFSFFLLLHSPSSKDNLNYMKKQIENLADEVPINTVKLKKLSNRLFAYVYDLFSEYKFLDLDSKTRKNKSSLSSIRQMTKLWFLENADDFFLKHFGQKTIYLILKIHDFYMQAEPAKLLRKKSAHDMVIENIQTDFNDFFLDISNSTENEIYKPLCIFVFVMKHTSVQLNQKYICKIVLQLLRPSFIAKIDNNKNISFDYFLNYFFDLYYLLRHDVKNSQEFRNHLETNKNKQ